MLKYVQISINQSTNGLKMKDGNINTGFISAIRQWKHVSGYSFRTERDDIFSCSSIIDMIMISGVGMSRLPLRLFCRPEVVVVKFKSGK